MIPAELPVAALEKVEIGTEQWFHDEAWKILHRGNDGIWDFSDSSLTYSPASMQSYGDVQQEETEYEKNVTRVEHELLRESAPQLVAHLPKNFSYVDLGPGTEHKEQYFFDELQKSGRKFEYFPIDISAPVLEESSRFASEKKITTHPIIGRFEDLEKTIDQSVPIPRFVSLGATFANYEPEELISLMLRIAGDKGSVMVTAQLRDRIDIENTKKAYREPQMLKIFEGKLGLLGIQPDDIECFDVTNDIVVRAKIKNPTPRLVSMGMMQGDWMTVLKSYRHSAEKIEALFRETDYTIYDTGKSFVVIHFRAKI